jgi:sugar phosphate isomerase/epimerase
MRLGIAQSLVPTDPSLLTRERVAQIAALGVTTVMTHFQVPPTEIAGRRGAHIAAMLSDEGLDVAACAGLRPNLVTDNDAARRASVEELRQLMLAAQSLGAAVITGGCGSHNPEHQYGPHPENHSQASRQRLVECLRDLAPYAEDTGVLVAMEPHVLTTLDTPENVRSILDEVDSPWIRTNFDPVNFVGSLADIYSSGACAKRAIDVLGPRVAPCAHIKDARVENGFVLHIAEAPPGRGIFDLAGVLEACRSLPNSGAVIVEHLTEDQIAEAVAYVASLGRDIGFEFTRQARGGKGGVSSKLEHRG